MASTRQLQVTGLPRAPGCTNGLRHPVAFGAIREQHKSPLFSVTAIVNPDFPRGTNSYTWSCPPAVKSIWRRLRTNRPSTIHTLTPFSSFLRGVQGANCHPGVFCPLCVALPHRRHRRRPGAPPYRLQRAPARMAFLRHQLVLHKKMVYEKRLLIMFRFLVYPEFILGNICVPVVLPKFVNSSSTCPRT